MTSTRVKPPPTRLGTDDVHVWTAAPDEIRTPHLLREYHALMDESERRKHDRYRFETHRHACLVTRALVRTTLSRYCPEVEPAAWRFVEVGNGRPEPAPGLTLCPVRFNLSHTDGLIACAVTLTRAIGVDVESLERQGETVAIADRYFAPAEIRALHAQPTERQRERFFSYWTLKESYIKARGLGLAIPLAQFAFDLDGPGPIRISFDRRLADNPNVWQFALERPTPRHILAVGVERGEGPDLDIRIRSVVPLLP